MEKKLFPIDQNSLFKWKGLKAGIKILPQRKHFKEIENIKISDDNNFIPGKVVFESRYGYQKPFKPSRVFFPDKVHKYNTILNKGEISQKIQFIPPILVYKPINFTKWAQKPNLLSPIKKYKLKLQGKKNSQIELITNPGLDQSIKKIKERLTFAQKCNAEAKQTDIDQIQELTKWQQIIDNQRKQNFNKIIFKSLQLNKI